MADDDGIADEKKDSEYVEWLKGAQGAKLKLEMQLQKVTVEEISHKTSRSEKTINNWLDGHHMIPQYEHIVLARILNCKETFLMDFPSNETSGDAKIMIPALLSLAERMDFEQISELVLAAGRIATRRQNDHKKSG